MKILIALIASSLYAMEGNSSVFERLYADAQKRQERLKIQEQPAPAQKNKALPKNQIDLIVKRLHETKTRRTRDDIRTKRNKNTQDEGKIRREIEEKVAHEILDLKKEGAAKKIQSFFRKRQNNKKYLQKACLESIQSPLNKVPYLNPIEIKMQCSRSFETKEDLKEIEDKLRVQLGRKDIYVEKIENPGKMSGAIFLVKNKENNLIYVLKQTKNGMEEGWLKITQSEPRLRNIPFFSSLRLTFAEKTFQIPRSSQWPIGTNIFILLHGAKGTSFREAFEKENKGAQEFALTESAKEMLRSYGRVWAEFHKYVSLEYFKAFPAHLNGRSLQDLKKDFSVQYLFSFEHPDMHDDNIFAHKKTNKKWVFSWIDIAGIGGDGTIITGNDYTNKIHSFFEDSTCFQGLDGTEVKKAFWEGAKEVIKDL